MQNTAPLLELNDGHSMPQLGFGTYSIHDVDLLGEAIESGYRLLDTATRYENEAEVGRAIAQASVPRDELFVTTKLAGRDHGRENVRPALQASLERLGLDQVDLYLIHWPLPNVGKFVETWEALVDLREAGLARSIGVSNFLPEHLDAIVGATGVAPAVNQVELHPYFPQAAQRQADASRGTVTQSWSPLGRGTNLLESPVLRSIGEKYGLGPGQVVLRWHTQIGAAPIPKSATPERIRTNLSIFDVTLDEAAMNDIAALETGVRVGGDPAVHEEF
ncbi:aldo/keto reductase [Aeromicrobium sp. CTD01-1L150]|uniref:aldo/keto reductase n=1 Tax=Aeromicrobium sp. CTD01-1L150 TaxID=3341830 RepID=UPI0035C1A93D